MPLNDGEDPNLTDAAGVVRPTALAPIDSHQDRQMITRKSVHVAFLIGNNYPLLDTLDACSFLFTTLEQTLRTIITNDPSLPSLLVK